MINPIAISFFEIDIYWYGLSYFIGFLFTYFFILSQAKSFNIKKEILEDIFFYSVLFGLIGARIFHVLFYNFSYYLNNPIKIFYFWEGGMAIHGAGFTFLLIIYYFSKKYNINYFKITDLFLIPAGFATSIGRIANFINQELVGTITSSKIGITFPLYDNQNRWPTQLFESTKNMITFQTLLYLNYFKKLKHGTITALFLIFYNFGRFIIDFLRVHDNSLGLISMGQLLSLIFGIFGIYILIKINNK